jgi:hypothetical protein
MKRRDYPIGWRYGDGMADNRMGAVQFLATDHDELGLTWPSHPAGA